ncbi:hypothetical protein BKH43_03760 [Helicobacter sp. 13S00401-1]|uniref:M23 family metallopeptidase n=1 Tax=Helicobacter sp. 13S00401-1 TaxID=1905758 RepID=UPI000BA55438|nr:M23 family metallopeptidase [Helicobacter sp. 13S00401-1]PAF50981.1 hypothetical protein BKH43_03760 [Helicobacter sp. 13S00401-1]
MQDNLMITIVDENGSKQFSITKFLHKLAIYGSIIFIIILILGYFLMANIISRLEDIESKRVDALNEYHQIYEQNEILKSNIQDKANELEVINNKINDLQSVVNIRHFNKDDAERKSIKLDSITKPQKALMLQIIPNGSPLEKYTKMQETSHKRQQDKSIKSSDYQVGNVTNKGYDYYTKEKEPVFATADGLVEFVRKNYRYGYGNIVRLVHTSGFSSAYAHLSTIIVKRGEFVSKGQIIGYSTPSTNPNVISLYYEVRFLSRGLDNLSFIKWNAENFSSIFTADDNSIIDFQSLLWAMDDLLKLKSISTHYTKDALQNSKQESIEASNKPLQTTSSKKAKDGK